MCVCVFTFVFVVVCLCVLRLLLLLFMLVRAFVFELLFRNVFALVCVMSHGVVAAVLENICRPLCHLGALAR